MAWITTDLEARGDSDATRVGPDVRVIALYMPDALPVTTAAGLPTHALIVFSKFRAGQLPPYDYVTRVVTYDKVNILP